MSDINAIPSEPPWTCGVRWGEALTEPLLSFAARTDIEDRLREFTEESEGWAVHFFAGVAADLAVTLPSVDPWKRSHLTGGVEDHLDLHPAADYGVYLPGSAAFEGGIARSAAEVVSAAVAGRDPAAQVLRSSDTLFADGTEAVRWLTLRRRSYMGHADTWVIDSTWWWAEQSYRLIHGQVEQNQLWEWSDKRLREELVPHAEYRPYRPT